MKMITAVAAAVTLAMSGVAFAGGPVAVKKESEPAPPAVVPSSAPGVGSLGAGAPVVAGLAALALVAALAGNSSSTGSTPTP